MDEPIDQETLNILKALEEKYKFTDRDILYKDGWTKWGDIPADLAETLEIFNHQNDLVRQLILALVEERKEIRACWKELDEYEEMHRDWRS